MSDVLPTRRLFLRAVREEDAGFILALYNSAPFLRFIGDKKLRTLADSRAYLHHGPFAHSLGAMGLHLVERRDESIPVGICGLIERDSLPLPDLGFAFLPEHIGRGYGYEASSGFLEMIRNRNGQGEILAVTQWDNGASQRLLRKLGFEVKADLPNADTAQTRSTPSLITYHIALI